MIAIVDDDASFRRAVMRFIRSLGYLVEGYASAEEFLASDRVADTDCLVTDVEMPGMSGVALQSHLIAQGCQLPTIFVTAFPEKSQGRTFAAGTIGLLDKPFDNQALIAHLSEALATSGH